jgi:tetratricopeptide (TPR) repeat protein
MDLKIAGNDEFRAGNWNKARELYTQALTVQPKLPEVFANRAACALQLHDYTAAIADCQQGLKFPDVSTQLRIKMWWRQAVALRMLGQNRYDWEKAVQAGLELDPNNDKLLAEKTFIFVYSTVPKEFLASQGAAKTSEMPLKIPPVQDFLPSLPLTYNGVLQLVRNKTPQAYQFWYEKVTGAQLEAALAGPGVEPDVIDYFHAMILDHPQEQAKNLEFLRALEKSPRYQTALFMADDKLSAKVAQLQKETS